MSTHRIVTRTKQDSKIGTSDFTFSREMVPALSSTWKGPAFLRDYRERAWSAFKSLPMPTVKDEAWRRTDIHGLEMAKFVIPSATSVLRLPSTPKRLLKPLVSLMHGGQIIIQPERTEINLDDALVQQGVIFTDLQTAEEQYAE